MLLKVTTIRDIIDKPSNKPSKEFLNKQHETTKLFLEDVINGKKIRLRTYGLHECVIVDAEEARRLLSERKEIRVQRTGQRDTITSYSCDYAYDPDKVELIRTMGIFGGPWGLPRLAHEISLEWNRTTADERERIGISAEYRQKDYYGRGKLDEFSDSKDMGRDDNIRLGDFARAAKKDLAMHLKVSAAREALKGNLDEKITDDEDGAEVSVAQVLDKFKIDVKTIRSIENGLGLEYRVFHGSEAGLVVHKDVKNTLERFAKKITYGINSQITSLLCAGVNPLFERFAEKLRDMEREYPTRYK